MTHAVNTVVRGRRDDKKSMVFTSVWAFQWTDWTHLHALACRVGCTYWLCLYGLVFTLLGALDEQYLSVVVDPIGVDFSELLEVSISFFVIWTSRLMWRLLFSPRRSTVHTVLSLGTSPSSRSKFIPGKDVAYFPVCTVISCSVHCASPFQVWQGQLVCLVKTQYNTRSLTTKG